MGDDRSVVRVAVPVPLADVFDYLAPPGGSPAPGTRVRVPFGRRERVGIVVEHSNASTLAPSKLKPIREVLDASAPLGAELMQSLRWAADYYHHPIGEVLSHALPAVLREGRSLDEPPERAWRLTEKGRAQPLAEIERRAKRQAQALAALRQREASETELSRLEIGRDVLERLADRGWIEPCEPRARVAIDANESTGGSTAGATRERKAPELTPDQLAVVTEIRAERAAGFRAYLLHGVTGSGKTEVYLRLIADELAANRQTLLLVPEIGLTPQLVATLSARFGGELALLHSGLTERERFEAWRKAWRNEARLVVGTRSAVFAPLPAAGLVIVDEEHDASYKQQSGFRYSARDLAVVRARRLGVPVVLASATPSLESFANVEQGRYRKLEMPRRIGSAGVPRMRIIDLKQHATRQALSTPLVAAIGEHLAAGNQVLLFLNRRGFAPALFCPQCKDALQCTRCDARLTVHARAGKLRCHHCGAERKLEWVCKTCGGERIAVGAGTQRVDDELAALFPGARVGRLDRDVTHRKGALAAVLDEVASGRTDILIGTQMLTKGHDFPRVTLVGVLNADQGLFGTDPRSHERLAQTILQVSGRAGRADRPGEVVIQTHYPEHPLLRCLLAHDYAAFASLELAERREAGWPPYSYLAAWRADATEREPAYALLNKVQEIAGRLAAGDVAILGPAPQPMERKEGRYRAQLLFRSVKRAALHELLRRTLLDLRGAAEMRRARLTLDVDPLEL
jgi:primosomal protein N' (replication factor Y) (superfamily II helicase)